MRFFVTAVFYTLLFFFMAFAGSLLPSAFAQHINLMFSTLTCILPIMFVIIIANRSHLYCWFDNGVALAGSVPISFCYVGYLWDFKYNLHHALMLFGKLSVQSSLFMFNLSTCLMVLCMIWFFLKLKKEN